MKRLTNHTPGLRGVTMKDGGVVWIKPGETVKIEDADNILAMPDLGEKPKADRDDDDDALKSALAEIETLKATIADRSAQIEALTKPADGAEKPATKAK